MLEKGIQGEKRGGRGRRTGGSIKRGYLKCRIKRKKGVFV